MEKKNKIKKKKEQAIAKICNKLTHRKLHMVLINQTLKHKTRKGTKSIKS